MTSTIIFPTTDADVLRKRANRAYEATRLSLLNGAVNLRAPRSFVGDYFEARARDEEVKANLRRQPSRLRQFRTSLAKRFMALLFTIGLNVIVVVGDVDDQIKLLRLHCRQLVRRVRISVLSVAAISLRKTARYLQEVAQSISVKIE